MLLASERKSTAERPRQIFGPRLMLRPTGSHLGNVPERAGHWRGDGASEEAHRRCRRGRGQGRVVGGQGGSCSGLGGGRLPLRLPLQLPADARHSLGQRHGAELEREVDEPAVRLLPAKQGG